MNRWGSLDILYSGKLSREKTFANFAVLWLFVKIFSAKFEGMASFDVAQASYYVAKVFSAKIVIREVFSIESFPLYGNSTPIVQYCLTAPKPITKVVLQ